MSIYIYICISLIWLHVSVSQADDFFCPFGSDGGYNKGWTAEDSFLDTIVLFQRYLSAGSRLIVIYTWLIIIKNVQFVGS